jgi:hypothetical protein
MRSLVVTGVAAAVVAMGGVPAAVALSHGGAAHHASHSVPGAHAPGHSDDKSDSKAGEKADSEAGEDHGKSGEHGSAHARQMVAIAAAHQVAMTHWSACVQAAAKAGKSNPASECVKPTPPGWVKHPGRH